MAKRDLNRYYLQVQEQYFEMLSIAKELKELYKDKIIDEQRFTDYQAQVEIIKANYERLSYVMLLLNKPNRKDKQALEERQNKEWYDHLKGASKEAILHEDRDALVELKELIRKTKEEMKHDS